MLGMQFVVTAGKGDKRQPITFCNSTSSYLSTFSKLVKSNGAPHASSDKLHAILNYPSKIAKRAQINFRNLLPFRMYEKRKKIFFLITI
jgi:hypothetical protein